MIAKQNDKKVVVDRRGLAEMVQRIARHRRPRPRSSPGLRPGEITVSAANPDLGEASETLACEYEGEALRIGLNPDYLGQFLAALETEKVLFELKDENSQCLGSPIGGEDDRYLCVIMPMRI